MKRFFAFFLLAIMLLSCTAVSAMSSNDGRFDRKNMMTRGVVTRVKDDMVTVKAKSSAYIKEVVLKVTNDTRLVDGDTGRTLALGDFKKGTKVSAYFDSNMNRSRNKAEAQAYAIVTGMDSEDARYYVVKEAMRSGNTTRVVDMNESQLISIPDSALMSRGPIMRNQELLVWLPNSEVASSGMSQATKATILSQAPANLTSNADIVIGMPNVTVVVNGQRMDMHSAVARYNNTIYLPLREVSEMLGYNVTWNANTRTAQVQYGAMMATATADSMNYGKNRANVRLDNAPRIVNGSTYVPVEFFTRILDRTVEVRDM